MHSTDRSNGRKLTLPPQAPPVIRTYSEMQCDSDQPELGIRASAMPYLPKTQWLCKHYPEFCGIRPIPPGL